MGTTGTPYGIASTEQNGVYGTLMSDGSFVPNNSIPASGPGNQYQNNTSDNTVSALVNAAINTADNVPAPSVASLTLNTPSYSDLQTQWGNFLNQAAQDPTIVNYYNELLAKAQGDYTTAVAYLEADYKTGVRQTQDTLQNTLEQLGVTFTGESTAKQASLNQKGIALTQTQPNSTDLTYGGGGEAGTELSTLKQSQDLRNEAATRSANQSIENLGLQRQQQESTAGSNYVGQQETIQGNKQQAITNEAQGNENMYLASSNAQTNSATNQANIGTTSSVPKSQTQRMADYTAAGGTGDLPVGFESS
jgi:hypothetical protein